MERRYGQRHEHSRDELKHVHFNDGFLMAAGSDSASTDVMRAITAYEPGPHRWKHGARRRIG